MFIYILLRVINVGLSTYIFFAYKYLFFVYFENYWKYIIENIQIGG